MLEAALDNYVCPLAHRCQCLVERFWARSRDLDDALARSCEAPHVFLLVREAAFPQDFEHRVVEERSLCELARRQSLEHREMAASDEVSQVGCEEERLVSPQVHALSPAPFDHDPPSTFIAAVFGSP